jgi:site-specific DNA recombinase
MAEPIERKRAVIYTRVSSTEQTEGFSLQTQEQFCREYAAQNGYDIERVFIERGVSAKTTDRPELQDMLRYIATNHRRLRAVIVYAASRLARQAYDHLELRATITRYGLRLLSVKEDFQDTPQGRKNETISAAEAQYDNEERAEKCTAGMIAAVQAGRYVWYAPLGYVNGGSRRRQSLVLDNSTTVSLVRKSFALIDAGFAVTKALQQVKSEGLRCRTGRELSLNTFRTMLMNKTYTGYIVAFGLTVRGDFDPIVSEDVFYRVQPKLHRAQKVKKVRYLRDNPEFPLRGVVRCPTCGHMMTASQSRGNGGKYGYYSCSKCGKSRFGKETLEHWFVENLQGLSLRGEHLETLSVAIDANLEANRKWVRNETSRVSNRIASLKEEKNAIVEKSIRGIIPDDMVKEWLEKASTEEEGLKCRLALVGDSALETPEVLNRGLAILGNMGSFWQKSNLTVKQQLQGFVFPEGVTAGKSGFGTDPIALCLRAEELPHPAIRSVVGPPGFEPRTKRL